MLAMLAILSLPHVAALACAPVPRGCRCRTPLMYEPESSLAQKEDSVWCEWASANGVLAPKLTVRVCSPEERGKGGVFASEKINAMEVIARVPRSLIVTPDAAAATAVADMTEESWAAEMTAAVLQLLHADQVSSDDVHEAPKREWVAQWSSGGWATDNSDLGDEDVRWGPKDVTGSLLSTGSDNDRNIYAKFRFPCHPVVHRASLGLALLTHADKKDALDALLCRSSAFRRMRDPLISIVQSPTDRPTGSLRDRRSWDVADTLSRVLSRAATVQLEESGPPSIAIVPLHERLAHSGGRGENTKLVGRNPLRADNEGDDERDDEVLLVATRDIERGEAITRDYELAPRLPDDRAEGPLRLLLQFGLPPSAWQ